MFSKIAIIALTILSTSFTSTEAHPHSGRSRHNLDLDKRATTAPVVKGWTYSGCVIDGSTRALPAKNNVNGAMTAEMCTSYCAGLGYVYAGLEAKNQCFCDNQLKNGLGTSVPESECNYQCAGDATQPCGGYWRMNLYRSGSAAAPTTSTVKTSTTTSKTSTSTAKTSTTSSRPATSAKTSTTTTKTSTTSSSTPTPTKETVATYYGCYQDNGSNRIMNSASTESSSMTPSTCQTFCSSKGYSLAGVSYGKQCFCGNSVDSSKKQSSESGCSYACIGNKDLKCGGFYYLNIYSSSGTIVTTTSAASSSTTSKAVSSSSSSKASTTSATSSTEAGAVASSAIGAPNPPAATGTKQLYAHHMVGNTYSYSQSTWADDINQASAAGIDGFALNYGGDYWQAGKIADAYAAAKADGGFKMFLSMDVSSLGCSSTNDAQNLINTIATYANNSAQAKVQGKTLVSTFAGENCKFGQSNYQNAWNYFTSLATNRSIDLYFVPATFADINTFKDSKWMDGEFNWNSAWSMNSSPLGTYSDTSYMNALGNSKGYMAAVSPAFFTYYSPQSYNKNWIYRGDDWLLARRMEQIIQMRDKFDLAEIISWNDYGESHYIGPIRADQPNSQGWTNGMPHTAWLEVIKYYAPAFKTGKYPSANDQLILWTRPHPKAATATSPSMSRPSGWDYTDDLLYVWVVLKSPSTVTVTSGSNSGSWNLPAGVSKVSVKSAPGIISAKITRNGATVRYYDSNGEFTYTNTPKDYNFNYFVASA